MAIKELHLYRADDITEDEVTLSMFFGNYILNEKCRIFDLDKACNILKGVRFTLASDGYEYHTIEHLVDAATRFKITFK